MWSRPSPCSLSRVAMVALRVSRSPGIGYTVVVERQHRVLPDAPHSRRYRPSADRTSRALSTRLSGKTSSELRSSSSTCIVTSRSANMSPVRKRICNASPRYTGAETAPAVTGVHRRLDGRSGGQYPRRAGEVHRDRDERRCPRLRTAATPACPRRPETPFRRPR